MKTRNLLGCVFALSFAAGVPLFEISTAAQSPKVSIQTAADRRVRISWPAAAGNFALEAASPLANPPVWKTVTNGPTQEGLDFVQTFDASQGDHYFRLRGAALPALTTISETSPASGETGVAVTRETIVRFSPPLDSKAQITPAQFYAEFGGWKVLSRVELSSDRLAATLFYLENLPSSARVRVTLNGNALADAQGRFLDADQDGQPGGSAIIDFETFSTTSVAGTTIMGRVFASELVAGPDTGASAINKPLEGVIITVDGMEQTLRTTTDAQGNFKLTNSPAGRFFVHIDGRPAKGSSYPNGAYYPFVGKAWEAAAGRQDNLAGGTGEIFLPLIKVGTLQTVSATQDTPITFPADVLQANPALQGVSITVPANSLFSDSGTRGGKVGIAPVPPDRLPEPLPAGLKFPLVLTVQSDGPSNFGAPVPARFPNLPDPVTGVLLAPGAKSALWSFNHDTGRWEIQGSMTVSADGKFVESDPGVGIRQPGWHGTQPGTPGGNPAGPPTQPEWCYDPGNAPAPAVARVARQNILPSSSVALSSSGLGCGLEQFQCALDCFRLVVSCFANHAVCAAACGRLIGSIPVLGSLLDELFCDDLCGDAEVCGNALTECKKACSRGYDACITCESKGDQLPLPAGRTAAATGGAADMKLGLQLMDDFSKRLMRKLELLREARAIRGAAKRPEDLSPAQVSQLTVLANEQTSLFGQRSRTDFALDQIRQVEALATALGRQFPIFEGESGFYRLENKTSLFVQRGTTDKGGIVTGLILSPETQYEFQV